MEPVYDGAKAAKKAARSLFGCKGAGGGSPLRIHCVYTDVEPGRRLREAVTGALPGVLETLSSGGGGTRAILNWRVRATNPVLYACSATSSPSGRTAAAATTSWNLAGRA